MTQCRRCGGEVVQKPLTRLTSVGLVMIAALILPIVWPILWAPAIIVGLTGGYLMAWALIGRGRWCRGCKRFDGV
jgi:hypothetical protein